MCSPSTRQPPALSREKMATIVAITLNVPGHLFPFVPVLRELQRRGHAVSFALCSYGNVPRAIDGIPIVQVSWPEGRRDAPIDNKPVFAAVPCVSDFAAFGEPLATPCAELFIREQPDFLLVDPRLWGVMTAAEGSGIAWGSLAHNPLCFRGLGIDTRGPGWRPPCSWLDRARQRALAFAMRIETADHLVEVNVVRLRRGLRRLASLTEMELLPPIILATTSEPFEYPRVDWPSGLTFVGPMIWDPPESEPLPTADARPTILVAGSTIAQKGDTAKWADVVLSALAKEPYRVIATLPSEPVNSSTAGIVPHRAPQSHSAILPTVTCVVCHGGPGIVQKALWFGVPVVAIPFGYDRFEVARRVEVANAGVMLPFSELTAESVSQAVSCAIGCRAGAQAVMRQFRASGGAPQAADVIESRLPKS